MQAPAGQICLLTGFFSVHFLRSLAKAAHNGPLGALFPLSLILDVRLVGAGIARPWPWAAAAKFPGGYGIRPYAVGVGVPDGPGMLPLPQSSGGRARLAPTLSFRATASQSVSQHRNRPPTLLQSLRSSTARGPAASRRCRPAGSAGCHRSTRAGAGRI